MSVFKLAKKLNKKYGKDIAIRASKAAKLQKRKERYKVFTRQELIDNNVEVFVDGIATSRMSPEHLRKYYMNYKTLEIYQWTDKYKRWGHKKPNVNKTLHERGINKVCKYYQIPLTINHKPRGIPLHRIVYAWFWGEIRPFNDNNELMDICHNDRDSSNNHITNLTWDTRKNNLAQRTGATNQWGKEKRAIAK